MARYIDADNLKQALTELYDLAKWDYRELHFSLFDMIGNIDGETTEDVKPVKHAHWIGVNPLSDTIECSSCGWEEISSELASRYCPDCGAKMDNWKEMQEDGLPSIERVEVHDG